MRGVICVEVEDVPTKPLPPMTTTFWTAVTAMSLSGEKTEDNYRLGAIASPGPR